MIKIYAIENVKNNKLYVGVTTESIEERFYNHIKLAERGGGNTIHNAIRKHGKESFEVFILTVKSNLSEAFEAERKYINWLDTYKGVGYNETKGGEGAPGKYNVGEKVWNTELTKKEIIKMRNKFVNNDDIKQIDLAKEYNLEFSTIYSILRGINWSHLPIPKGMDSALPDRLSKTEKEEIKKRYIEEDITQSELAKQYDSTTSAVKQTVNEVSNIEHSKLDNNKVEEIRIKYYDSENSLTYADLGDEYGVDQSIIGRAVRGDTWKDAPGPTK